MITTQLFGTTKEGQQVTKFILKNINNFEVHLLDYGLTIQKILYPTQNTAKQDIVLGFDTIEAYEENQLYLGCIIGRNANRLSNGSIVIEGKEIKLSQNEFPKQLHGGFKGFDKQIWNCSIIENKIIATYTSPNLEEGFPGEVITTITFELTDNNELKINTKATTNKTTVVNLTRHDYFNLLDAGATKAIMHQIQINGEAFTPTTSENLVTGDLLSVKNHPIFDLRKPTVIKDQLENNKKVLPMGYDHNYSVNPKEELKSVALAIEPESGRKLELFSTQPGIQFYTAAYVNNVIGKNGAIFQPSHSFCLETQHFPDATKHLHFSSTIITPETPYTQKLIYKFTA